MHTTKLKHKIYITTHLNLNKSVQQLTHSETNRFWNWAPYYMIGARSLIELDQQRRTYLNKHLRRNSYSGQYITMIVVIVMVVFIVCIRLAMALLSFEAFGNWITIMNDVLKCKPENR